MEYEINGNFNVNCVNCTPPDPTDPSVPGVVDPAYPGTALRRGSSSTDVSLMQTYLNALNAQYPQIGRLTVDGKYGSSTEAAVRRYQAIKGLSADGVIGQNTWNAIVSEYNTYNPQGPDTYPGTAMRSGSRGVSISKMQTYLNDLSRFYTAIPSQTVDGIYGSNTTTAVRLFQKQFGLSADGVIGRNTWNAIIRVHNALTSGSPTKVSTAYPGTVLRQGSTGDSVRFVQSYLNTISVKEGGAFPTVVVDGKYGRATRNQVMAFQTRYGLNIDGAVGPATWSRMITEYNNAI